jgi:hypothetical protein
MVARSIKPAATLPFPIRGSDREVRDLTIQTAGLLLGDLGSIRCGTGSRRRPLEFCHRTRVAWATNSVR